MFGQTRLFTAFCFNGKLKAQPELSVLNCASHDIFSQWLQMGALLVFTITKHTLTCREGLARTFCHSRKSYGVNNYELTPSKSIEVLQFQGPGVCHLDGLL